ncbi:acetyltransferase, GNAT family [Labilithrix luteola]|uniref:Acetyltransferase, GNAT family n=1 Tax=Labilithrix luteola TaxID=1391654 RepID=A0A0K1PVJ9_9BACT|nr:GNAT family N-acetyltransferase [Labilithrix luteola]AKU97558.1 acetyltransferase, GNAT family [Labilithrix luteola]
MVAERRPDRSPRRGASATFDIVGHAFLFAMGAWFGNRKVRMGGIASVAVALEARGLGVGTGLLNDLHVRSHARGDALTMLYPFRQGYYARLGYGPTTSRRRLAFDPASVPASWRALAIDGVGRLRAEDREAVTRVYERAARRTSGWIERSANAWERRFMRERVEYLIVRTSAGGPTGYVAFTIAQEEPHAETKVLVEELVSMDDRARRALLGALGGLRDQIASIELEVDATDALELALVDPDARRHGTEIVEHDLGTIVGGPMVRIDGSAEGIVRAIEARGYLTDGRLDLVVVPELDAKETLALSIRVERGRARARASRGAALRVPRRALASVLYGGLLPSAAVRLGLAECDDPRALARADALLAIPPLAPVEPF